VIQAIGQSYTPQKNRVNYPIANKNHTNFIYSHLEKRRISAYAGTPAFLYIILSGGLFMTCLANNIFKEKMQNLIWDGILRDKDEWEAFCRDKVRVDDFFYKSQTIIDLDCLIEKLDSFFPRILTKEEYTELKETWDKTKENIKF
jgi:hypothetical protein